VSAAAKNLYVFRFRLQPAYVCRALYWEFVLQEASVTCSRDILSVIAEVDPADDLRPHLLVAKRIGAAVLDAHAYVGFPDHPALDLHSEGWVEIQGGAGLRPVVGYSDPSIEVEPLSREAPENGPFFGVPGVLSHVRTRAGLGTALADFRAA
jgi:hypothetical protein